VPDLATIECEPNEASASGSTLRGPPKGTGLAGGLRELYASHAPLAWRALRRLGVSEVALEDALQDVFLVLHRRMNEFEARASITTWIYGIVLRVAKDYRRAEARHSARLTRLAQQLATELDSVVDPAYAVEHREANQLMHVLLAKLADDLREVLVLVELEDLPLREACQSLGVNQRTGQRRLRAARKEFDALLACHLNDAGRSTP
jgi:RNA polymerase sigma-70 factor (ECF subfamily)